MIRLLAVLSLILLCSAPARAERLLLALVNIGESASPEALVAELGSTSLDRLADEKAPPSAPILRGGNVQFYAELPVVRNATLGQTVTYAGARVSIEYSVRGGSVAARLVLEKLEKLGFRTESRSTYEGRGEASGRTPFLLSVSRREGRTVDGSRLGQVRQRSLSRTTALLAQVVP